MTGEDKYQGYTPMLSKKFSDFAGMCTLEEFMSTFFKSLIWFMIYVFVFVIWGIFFCASLFDTLINGLETKFIVAFLAGLGLIYFFYRHIGKPIVVVFVKRLHAFGKSFTRWILIHNALYLFVAVVVCWCVGAENINLAIVILPFIIYNGFFVWEMCFDKSPNDDKIALKTTHTKSVAAKFIVKNMRSTRPKAATVLSKQPIAPSSRVRTTSTVAKTTIQKTARPSFPTPPTPPSHQ